MKWGPRCKQVLLRGSRFHVIQYRCRAVFVTGNLQQKPAPEIMLPAPFPVELWSSQSLHLLNWYTWGTEMVVHEHCLKFIGDVSLIPALRSICWGLEYVVIPHRQFLTLGFSWWRLQEQKIKLQWLRRQSVRFSEDFGDEERWREGINLASPTPLQQWQRMANRRHHRFIPITLCGRNRQTMCRPYSTTNCIARVEAETPVSNSKRPTIMQHGQWAVIKAAWVWPTWWIRTMKAPMTTWECIAILPEIMLLAVETPLLSRPLLGHRCWWQEADMTILFRKPSSSKTMEVRNSTCFLKWLSLLLRSSKENG